MALISVTDVNPNNVLFSCFNLFFDFPRSSKHELMQMAPKLLLHGHTEAIAGIAEVTFKNVHLFSDGRNYNFPSFQHFHSPINEDYPPTSYLFENFVW